MDKKLIAQMAEETLGLFKRVADQAQAELSEPPIPPSSVLANVNEWTSDVLRQFQRRDQEKRESLEKLAKEPAIARVVALDENGDERIFYFCSHSPPHGFPNLVNYKAKAGRLASLPIGEEWISPNGTALVVHERARLHPTTLPQGWDSTNTVIQADQGSPITVESLRALIEESARAEPNTLDELLSEDTQKAIISAGIRRSVIAKMALRDQPILDQYQDEIFRLPLSTRLMILGPPGTGKTTTLIRRLGQKLNSAFLDDDEKRLAENIAGSNGIAHEDSWLMFTPTELLRQFLKEAFVGEGLAASNRHITTWNQYRRELGRTTFGILRTSSDRGVFVLKESIEIVTGEAIERPIEWFLEFERWQYAAFLQELRQAADSLGDDRSSEVATMGKELTSILTGADQRSLHSVCSALAIHAGQAQSLVTARKAATDEKIRGTLNLQVNRDRGFLDALAQFMDQLETQASDDDEQDDVESEEEEETQTSRTGRMAAARAYMKAVRTHARAHANKRTLSKNSRNGRIVEWLQERTLSEVDRSEVGASLFVQANARRFVNPVKRYLDGIPRRYRAFRRLKQDESKWYTRNKFAASDLHPLELDVILLAILSGASVLLSKPEVLRSLDAPVWSALKPVSDLYKSQILVDEATDFSPLQLACMAAITHPRIRSFFACGDFNQRLTIWGSRSRDDLKWVFPDIDFKEIRISYRQTRQLNELARAIISAAGGAEQAVVLPEHVDSEGVAPALLEGSPDKESVASWLAGRIREVERFVGKLPSVAVFVDSDATVVSLAKTLDTALADSNIRAVACTQGQVMGQDSDVRVFDIQHIKGLEFEAVFLVGIDRLAAIHPQLIDKYLYVGTTRAATYLGVTCETNLPSSIASLRSMFVSHWEGG